MRWLPGAGETARRHKLMKTSHSMAMAAVTGWLWLGPTAELPAQVYAFSTPAGNPAIVDPNGLQ